ncbi:alpha/beta hydrolase [Phytohabitans rumicis]|uniref:Alpha/beta hydrolase n=1 Tax=Phytohabitans rumicis TaxID=1076125 RepID=A0A6V8L0S5_9ACTN|nr:alpha/beta hydrolase [Phytohabitans rumicis]GFJ88391.1 alpha/beta hydrolase [Phytohabitans rumicis]
MPVHPNLDAELAAIVAAGAMPPVDFAGLTVADIPELRVQMDAMLAAMGEPPADDRVVTEDRLIPGPDGDPDIKVRIYRPAGLPSPAPVVYWIHGGGMILGDLRTGENVVVDLACEVGCAVVSVEYRLAPEHPDPAPVEDCYAGLVWVAKNAAELGFDPDRIAVAGGSAGGGLAAGTALLARDRGGPALAMQMLIYPMLDDGNDSPSAREFSGEWPSWNWEASELGWNALLGERRGTEAVSPYAAPARAADLTALPRTYIDVTELEVFRDECYAYARRLSEAGVSTEFHVYPGVFHAWEMLAPETALARQAHDLRVAALRRWLTRQP